MPARILAVEASHDVRVLLSDLLTADGHEVQCVGPGPSGSRRGH